eukprot:TRINITY_DN5138_c0_g1_i5.p1 TRINITY_DN5138_c0_g1~~TRINITY_DN5138_c0_g1_i5.p1  ORF type:complete len:965 (-),score=391.54 TRINITY_DN5138_c0_g1_i5:19-2700(-)
MNQFKPIFLGQIDPKDPMYTLKRAANSQKCIRAGGKHNDLEDVGKDTYHHTFFEMLGNWSFGDYFKKEAIDWAWELLTVDYGLKKENLYASYFGGNEAANLPVDEAARDFWLQYLPPQRVLPFGMKENFWEMGDTGPCGPCSEIHYDRIGGRDASSLVNADDPTVIEIWNNVFIQFNREVGGELKPLPACHVDTGMGLERITSILQQKLSNYDIDLFQDIFKEISRETGARPYAGKLGQEDTDNIDMAYRVIADHLRTVTFAIADGARPDKEGRNYVVRRILRRAIRYGRQTLKAKAGFFHQLIPVVSKLMSNFYPELIEAIPEVVAVVKEEELAFERTLERGLELFKKVAETSKNNTISGNDVFTLYSTFGFPVDLVQILASERGFKVDMIGYETRMEEEKELSRAGTGAGKQPALKMEADAVAQLHKKNVAATNDDFKFELKEIDATVKAVFDGKEFVDQTTSNEMIGIVTDKTNFYAEQGGQIFDTGVMANDDVIFQVENVQSYGGYVLHCGRILSGTMKPDISLKLVVDLDRRNPIMSNHTSTHVLNFSLREVLKGSKVDQKGSLVDKDKLRFDFSHNKAVSHEEIVHIEKICGDIITNDLQVFRKSLPLEQARSIYGVRAVFGETYPDPVTVVAIGKSVDEMMKNPSSEEWAKYSVEFCGGTHITSTGASKKFVVVSESGIAKGVRRIIAVTGEDAFNSYRNVDYFNKKFGEAKTKSKEEIEKAIAALKLDLADEKLILPLVERLRFDKELDDLVSSQLAGKKEGGKGALAKAEEISTNIGQKKFVVEDFNLGDDRKALSNVLNYFKEKNPDVAVMLFSRDPKKVNIMVSVPASQQSKLGANQWVQDVAKVGNGKGGGKVDAAQGSLELNLFDAAFEQANKIAQEKFV